MDNNQIQKRLEEIERKYKGNEPTSSEEAAREAVDVDADIDDVINQVRQKQQQNTQRKDRGIGQPSKDVEYMSELELLEKVMQHGSIRFNDGRMLTACPAYSTAAICGLYSVPNDVTGQANMVCTGPLVIRKSRSKILGGTKVWYQSESCKYGCPFHPSKVNEHPQNKNSSGDSGGGWL